MNKVFNDKISKEKTDKLNYSFKNAEPSKILKVANYVWSDVMRRKKQTVVSLLNIYFEFAIT